VQQHNLEPNLVIWVPTPQEVVARMLGLAGVSSEDIVCDLGCGDGRVLVSAVREFGARRAIGYELRPDLCRSCRKTVLQLGLEDKIEIVNGDLRQADLSQASVVTLYLTTSAHQMLVGVLGTTLRAGSRVVTYLFPIPGWLPAREVDLASFLFEEGRFVGKLYLYLIPPMGTP
jgi:precorrin-6B methylase 2